MKNRHNCTQLSKAYDTKKTYDDDDGERFQNRWPFSLSNPFNQLQRRGERAKRNGSEQERHSHTHTAIQRATKSCKAFKYLWAQFRLHSVCIWVFLFFLSLSLSFYLSVNDNFYGEESRRQRFARTHTTQSARRDGRRERTMLEIQ